MDRWKILIEKYIAGSISRNELRELLRNAEEQKDIDQLISAFKDQWEKSKEVAEEDKAYWERKFEEMMEEERELAPVVQIQRRSKTRWLYRVVAAAVVLAVVATGAYIFVNKKSKQEVAQATIPKQNQDIKPGGNNAVLTLADGSTIVLDSAANGSIAQQGNTKIIKLDSGRLAYNSQSNQQPTIQYNTVSTPKGGQYQVTLSDGTKVWLNAASSLKYQTVFNGKERNVELTGEAYFEVAHNPAMPFHVKVNNMTVEVLGTHFNVMAYGDEDAVKTTLLEGAVRVMNGGLSTVKLVPGQQAQLNKNGDLKLVKDADIDLAVAWKNGYTSFKSADIKSIMRQVERWYNVDVVYEGNIPERTFTGDVPRDAELSQLLKILEISGIHFAIEGRKLTVQP